MCGFAELKTSIGRGSTSVYIGIYVEDSFQSCKHQPLALNFLHEELKWLSRHGYKTVVSASTVVRGVLLWTYAPSTAVSASECRGP